MDTRSLNDSIIQFVRASVTWKQQLNAVDTPNYSKDVHYKAVHDAQKYRLRVLRHPMFDTKRELEFLNAVQSYVETV